MQGGYQAVTGLGWVSSLGMGVEAAWQALLTHAQPSRRMTPVGDRTVQVVTVPCSDAAMAAALGLPTAQARRMNRAWLFALSAAQQAIADAWGDGRPHRPDRVGVFAGTTLAGTEELEALTREYKAYAKAKGLSRLLFSAYGSLADLLAAQFELGGQRGTVSTACSSSLLALANARAALAADEVDAALVVGTDALAETSVAGFSCLGAMTDGVSRPFSEGGAGIMLGEGAAALVLEKTPRLRAHCYLAGTSVQSEAHHATAPDPSGRAAVGAMRDALAEAQVPPHRVGLVVAHGTGTTLNDGAEASSINAALESTGQAWVMSTKGATGHTLGAAGAINAVVACLALSRQQVPPSPMFSTRRTECAVKVCTEAQNVTLHAALANAFGFAGSVGSALFVKEAQHKQPKQHSQLPKKIFVTGFGFASHAGSTELDLADALCCPQRKYQQVPRIESYSGRRNTQWAGLVDASSDDVRALLRRCPEARRMDRTSLLAYVAVTRLFVACKVRVTERNQKKIGLLLGTQSGPLTVIEKFYERIVRKGVASGNPMHFANTVLNACLGYITTDHQLHGPSSLIVQNEAAAAITIAMADTQLLSGGCESVVCGGVEEASDAQLRGFLDLGQTPSGGEPDERSVPFDDAAKGFYLADGAYTLLLETEVAMHAAARKPRLRYLGSAQSGAALPGPGRYSVCATAVANVLHNATSRFGVPSLIISNACAYPAHDAELKKGIASAGLHAVPHLTPIGLLGNPRGAIAGLGLFAAAVAIDRQRLPKRDVGYCLDDAGPVSTVFVVSSAPGGYAVVNAVCSPEPN